MLSDVEVQILSILWGLMYIGIPITHIYFVVRLIDSKDIGLIYNGFKNLQKLRYFQMCRLRHPLFWLISKKEWKEESKRLRWWGIRDSDYEMMCQLQDAHNFPGEYNGIWCIDIHKMIAYFTKNNIQFKVTETFKKEYVKVYPNRKRLIERLYNSTQTEEIKNEK